MIRLLLLLLLSMENEWSRNIVVPHAVSQMILFYHNVQWHDAYHFLVRIIRFLRRVIDRVGNTSHDVRDERRSLSPPCRRTSQTSRYKERRRRRRRIRKVSARASSDAALLRSSLAVRENVENRARIVRSVLPPVFVQFAARFDHVKPSDTVFLFFIFYFEGCFWRGEWKRPAMNYDDADPDPARS